MERIFWISNAYSRYKTNGNIKMENKTLTTKVTTNLTSNHLMKENKTFIAKPTKQINHQYHKQIQKNKNKLQTHSIDLGKYVLMCIKFFN